MDINRELAELLGLCWHEIINTYEQTGWNEGFIYKCQRCNKISNHDEYWNSDFTTDPGKIELLRLMMKREDWVQFAKAIGGIPYDLKFDPKTIELLFCRWSIPLDNYITDTTGLLAQAAVEWLTAQKEGV